jgi:hypothetical protein
METVKMLNHEIQTPPLLPDRFESFADLCHFDIMFNSVFNEPSRRNFCPLGRPLAMVVSMR